MKKIILSTAVMLCFALLASRDAAAADGMTVTHQTGQQCVCRDLDHWVDAKKAGAVQLTCGNTTTFYADSVLTAGTIKEYTCGTAAGTSAVVTDSISRKVLVSAAKVACAKDTVAQTVYPAEYPSWYVPYAKKKIALAACGKKSASVDTQNQGVLIQDTLAPAVQSQKR